MDDNYAYYRKSKEEEPGCFDVLVRAAAMVVFLFALCWLIVRLDRRFDRIDKALGIQPCVSSLRGPCD